MVSGLLYKWEDSPALSKFAFIPCSSRYGVHRDYHTATHTAKHATGHHCGFCERPLSHPGARVSCFGTHSEPCFRFHQVCIEGISSRTAD
jgi:hypothetical protein